MGTRVTADADMADKHLLDTGLSCTYDGDTIEYTDPVIVVLVIKPGVENGRVLFYDIMTENKDDYLYEPVFFHGKNWDEIEEQFQQYVREHPAIPVDEAILNCAFCKSGILPGEATGAALTGEVVRSQRNPDLQAYGNHFEAYNLSPTVICISCMMEMNNEIIEMWEGGVSNTYECPEGTYARCWRDGCPGECPNNIAE